MLPFVRRSISIGLAVLLIGAIVVFCAPGKASSFSVALAGPETAIPDSTIAYTIRVSEIIEPSGLLALGYTLTYDRTVLQYKNYKATVKNGWTAQGADNPLSSGVVFLLSHGVSQEALYNGDTFSVDVNFTVKSTASPDKPITLSLIKVEGTDGSPQLNALDGTGASVTTAIVSGLNNKTGEGDPPNKDGDIPIGNGGAAPDTPSDPETDTLRCPFADIKTTDWYYSAVMTVYTKGLFSGTAADKFNPLTPMTRGMFATVLARLDGVRLEDYAEAPFADLDKNAFYAKPVAWAAQLGLINGYGGGRFGPNDNITREQMAFILSNYIKHKGLNLAVVGDGTPFADSDRIGSWAMSAVSDMRRFGLINGKPGHLFDPKGTATRAEVATIFMNYLYKL